MRAARAGDWLHVVATTAVKVGGTVGAAERERIRPLLAPDLVRRLGEGV